MTHYSRHVEALGAILEAGIAEFARCGFQPASIAAVAKNAGVSIGVIYKYFGDKDTFFLACVRHSLELLDATLQEAAAGGGPLAARMQRLILALIRQSRSHASYNAMYNEITSGSCRKYAGTAAGNLRRSWPARSNRARQRFIRACLTARSRAASSQSGSSRSCLRFSLTIC